MNRNSRQMIAAFLIALQASTSFGRVYVVQKGDTLSKIVSKEVGRPVYGNKGHLKKVLQWNQNISNPDRIRPKQNIRLGPNDFVYSPAQASPARSGAQPSLAKTESEKAAAAANLKTAEPAPTQARFGLDVDALLGRTTIEATSKEKLFITSPHSRLNQGILIRGSYFINKDAAFGLQLGFEKSEFVESRDERLTGSKKVLKEIAVFYQRVLLDRWHVEASLGTEQAFFLSQLTTADFQLDPIFVDFLKLKLGYDVIAEQNWRWNLAVNGKLNQAADGPVADAERGRSYGASTVVRYFLNSDLSWNAGLHYERRVQNSSQSTQRNSDLSASLGLTLLLGR